VAPRLARPRGSSFARMALNGSKLCHRQAIVGSIISARIVLSAWRPVATARFEKATLIDAKSTETVTAAFDASLADVMRRVVDWTLQQGNAASATGSG